MAGGGIHRLYSSSSEDQLFDEKSHVFMTDREWAEPTFCGLVYPRQFKCYGGFYAYFLVPCLFLYPFVVYNVFGVKKYMGQDEKNNLWAIISGIIFNVLIFLSFFSWFRTVYTSPGYVVKNNAGYNDNENDNNDNNNDHSNSNNNNNNNNNNTNNTNKNTNNKRQQSFWEVIWDNPFEPTTSTKNNTTANNNPNHNPNNSPNSSINNSTDNMNTNTNTNSNTDKERTGERPLLSSSPSSPTPSPPPYFPSVSSSPSYPATLSPTHPPSPSHLLSPPASPSLLSSPSRTSASLFCKKCHSRRPPRAHHCRVCNRCVLRMDHHCPWVNNCVGFYNYKFFFLFVAYTLSLAFWCCFSLLALFCMNDMWSPLDPLLFSVFVLSVIIILFLSALCFNHCCITAPNNITTVEMVARRRKQRKGEIEGGFWNFDDHPYNLSCNKNIQEMFGPPLSLSCCPLTTLPPEWNGWDYPEQANLRRESSAIFEGERGGWWDGERTPRREGSGADFWEGDRGWEARAGGTPIRQESGEFPREVPEGKKWKEVEIDMDDDYSD